MGMSLSGLMEQIGIAVQNANAAIEQYASEIYLKQGYVEREKEDQEDGDEHAKAYEPITFLLDMPTENSKRKMRVPVTALMHHSSLQLEQVDVKLRFALEEREGEEVNVKVIGTEQDNDSNAVSELSMQFRTALPPEGTARIENRHIQTM